MQDKKNEKLKLKTKRNKKQLKRKTGSAYNHITNIDLISKINAPKVREEFVYGPLHSITLNKVKDKKRRIP